MTIRYTEDVHAVKFPVLFHLNTLTPEVLTKLRTAAVQADEQNGNDEPLGGYTLEQALIVVFHDGGTEGLRETGVLAGWTIERQPEPESWNEAQYPEPS